MDKERKLAIAAVEAYGRPQFPQLMLAFEMTIPSPKVRLQLLEQAGLKQVMLNHANALGQGGQRREAHQVRREVGIMFGKPRRSSSTHI